MQLLKDRVAVVTGAASGIGKGLAEEFAERGLKVVLVDINALELERLANELRAKGADVAAECVDVTHASDMEALAKRCVARFGAVHVLCNNAGVGVTAPSPWELDVEEWKFILEVNLMGVVHGLRAFMPILLEQEEAHVVNTGSISGLIISPDGAGAYTVAKHAVVALSETTHCFLLIRNARVGVSCLCPGPVNTNITTHTRERYDRLGKPMRRTPHDVAYGRAFDRWIVEEGMAPRLVAKLTCDGIVEKRFYILPHDYTSWIEHRMTCILQGKTPELQPFPAGLGLRIYEELKRAGLVS